MKIKKKIRHLTIECTYSRLVWAAVGVTPVEPLDILDRCISQAEFEIRVDLISSLVFRQQTLQPEVLIQTTKARYNKGICTNQAVTRLAQTAIMKHAVTGQWH